MSDLLQGELVWRHSGRAVVLDRDPDCADSYYWILYFDVQHLRLPSLRKGI